MRKIVIIDDDELFLNFLTGYVRERYPMLEILSFNDPIKSLPSITADIDLLLIDLEMLDDRAFAQYWVEQRESFKPRSRRALSYELYQKGVKREIVDEIVDEVDEDAAAFRAGRQKAHRWASLPEDQFRQDMNRFLQRRGFNYSIIAPATEKLWLEVGSDDHQQ